MMEYESRYFAGASMVEHPQDEFPEIRIDRDGVWYYRNMEMTRIEIVQYFYQHLRRDGQGNYRIELNHEHCRIHVEDAPYVIRSVSLDSAGADERPRMFISLSDGSSEELDPETIRIGEKDILYCRVKNNAHEARFSRPAYYQLAENMNHDPHQNRYFILIGNRSYTLPVNRKTEIGGAHAG
jgi:hypothetical protein